MILLLSLLQLILFLHSSIAVPVRPVRIASGMGVIAKVSRENFEVVNTLPPIQFESRKKNPFVLFLNTEECLEIAANGRPFVDDPYFVAFSTLNLGIKVESFMGSTASLGVLLRRIKLVAADGKLPSPLQLPSSRGTCLEPGVFDVIYRAFLFAEQRKRAPTIADVNQLPVISAVKLINDSGSAGRQPTQLLGGMIVTASPVNFQEDRSLVPLPWARERRFPFVFILNKDLWCLEVVPDVPRFHHSNYFVSFTSLGLRPANLKSKMVWTEMGVLLRRIQLVSAGGEPPLIKPVKWSMDERLPEATFNTVVGALMFMDKYRRKPTTKEDLHEVHTLVSNCLEGACIYGPGTRT